MYIALAFVAVVFFLIVAYVREVEKKEIDQKQQYIEELRKLNMQLAIIKDAVVEIEKDIKYLG